MDDMHTCASVLHVFGVMSPLMCSTDSLVNMLIQNHGWRKEAYIHHHRIRHHHSRHRRPCLQVIIASDKMCRCISHALSLFYGMVS